MLSGLISLLGSCTRSSAPPSRRRRGDETTALSRRSAESLWAPYARLQAYPNAARRVFIGYQHSPWPTTGGPLGLLMKVALSRCCLRKEREKRAHVILIKPCPTQGVPAPSLFRLQLRPPCPIPGVFAPILFGHQLCHLCPTPGVIVSAPSLYGLQLCHPCPTLGVPALGYHDSPCPTHCRVMGSVLPARLQACWR